MHCGSSANLLVEVGFCLTSGILELPAVMQDAENHFFPKNLVVHASGLELGAAKWELD